MTWGIAKWTGAIDLDQKTPTPAVVAGPLTASVTFQATDTDSTSISSGSYTFPMTVASAVGQERLVALGSICGLAGNFTAVTVDGQMATRVGTLSRGADGGGGVCSILTFYRAPGTSGTNISIVATVASGPTYFSGYCALWALNNADRLIASTNAATNDPTISTNTVTDGAAVAAVLGYTGTSPTVAWTGLTEVFDAVRAFGDDVFSGASANIATGSTPLAISANITPDLSASSSIASICVSFGCTDGDPWEANAWAAAVVASGGSVSTTRKDLIDALIVGLKADGIWIKLDRLWIFAAENSQSALIDLKAQDQSTAVNSPTFTANRGYAGNGSTSYINTTYVVSTDAANYTSSSMHVGIWDNTSRASNGTIILGFYDGGSNLTDLFVYATTFRPNFVVGTSGSPGSSQGFFLCQQISGTGAEIYFNGSNVGTGGAAAAIVAGSNPFYIGARNDNGTPAGGTTDQFSMFSVGGKLTSTEAGNYYTRMRTYMTAVGVP